MAKDNKKLLQTQETETVPSNEELIEEPVVETKKEVILHKVKNSLGRDLTVQWGDSQVKLLKATEVWEIPESIKDLDSLRKKLEHLKVVNYVDFV